MFTQVYGPMHVDIANCYKYVCYWSCQEFINSWSCIILSAGCTQICVSRFALSPPMYVCVHAHVHTHAHTHACTHARTHAHTHAHTHTHTHAHTHAHTQTHTHKRTHIHTHTHTCTHRQIARIHHLVNEPMLALTYQHKATLIFERVLGIDHPDTIRAYINLALYCHNTHQVSAGLRLLYRARYLILLVFGEGHPELATCDTNIALLLHSVKDYNHSLVFLMNALKIHERYAHVLPCTQAVGEQERRSTIPTWSYYEASSCVL